MKPYYGEQAFPQKEPLTSDCHGMSLRDYFAAKAMAVVLRQCTEFPDHAWRIVVAMSAYKMADAMLAARSNENEC